MNIALVLCGVGGTEQRLLAFFLKEGGKFEGRLKVLTGIIRIWHEHNR